MGGERGINMEDQLFDFYQSYNAERYIHFRFVPTGQHEMIEAKRDGKVIFNRKPILEKQKLSFEEVKELNLDNYGQDVRTAAEDFTLIHNYLLDFWSAIMGSEAVMLYIHLKRYCYSGKDFCYPNMTTIREKMKKGSKATINKYMEILERHGFIAKINRIDTERNNGNASPFFKVRRYIPLLSQDLINELPLNLKKEHDKFLARANGIDLMDTFDPDEFITDLMKSAKLMKSKQQQGKEEELKRKGKLKEYILTQMSQPEQETWFMLLNHLKDKVSKPSFDTWIKDSVFFVNEETKVIKVYVANQFTIDWLTQQYKEMIINVVNETLNIENLHLDCVLYEDYLN